MRHKSLRKKFHQETNKQTNKGMCSYEHYQCLTFIKRHKSLSYVTGSSALLCKRVLQRLLEKILTVVSNHGCNNSVLTVLQAMFDSRQAVATSAV